MMNFEAKKLIKAVKKYVFLYDISHKYYKNTGLKAETWEIIAKKLGRDVSEVKVKWKAIKDGYLKYKKSKETETPDKPVCDYVWKDHLAFLDEHHTTKNFAIAQLSARSPSLPDSPAPDGHRAKRQRTSIDDSSINKLVSMLGERQEYDDVDHLFESYAKTFMKLFPRQQAHVKVEMAKLFADAELELVNNEQPVQEVSSNQYLGPDMSNVQLPLTIKIEHYPDNA